MRSNTHQDFVNPEAYADQPHPLESFPVPIVTQQKMATDLFDSIDHDFNHHLIEDIEGTVGPKMGASCEASSDSGDDEGDMHMDQSYHSDCPSLNVQSFPPLPPPELSREAAATGRALPAATECKRCDPSCPNEYFPEGLPAYLYGSSAAPPLTFLPSPTSPMKTSAAEFKSEPELALSSDNPGALSFKSLASSVSPRRKRTGPERVGSQGSEESESEDVRKVKQERNRICAKECRKRKKQYMENMEAQVLCYL